MLTSTSVSDALQELGEGGVICHFSAQSDLVVVGEAFTVRLCPPERSERPFNDWLDEVPEGSIVVLDNDGRRGMSVMGGLVAAEARRRGARGAIVNGDVRDVAEARELRFGVFALGATPRSGRPNVRVQATNEPITWDGVRIEPGDTIVADEDGVAVVPARHAAKVLERAAAIEARDAVVLKQVTAGVPLARAQVNRVP